MQQNQEKENNVHKKVAKAATKTATTAVPTGPTQASDRSWPPNTLLALQQQQGNSFVQRLLQPTVSSSTPNALIQRTPDVDFIEGTTDEMKSELARLQQERDELMASCMPTGHRGGQNCPPEVGQYNRLIAKLNTYLAERGNSTLPDASIELIFNGTTLDVAGAESASFSAVSGKPDSSGSFSYTHERQRLPDTGPIPEGIYWIDPTQLKSLWYYVGGAADAWGSHRITIHPFHTTPTFGRGGFFIHGGSTPGSAGCIDLTGHMADLAEIISRYEGNKIKIHIRYPHPPSPGMGDFPTPESHYG